MKHLILLLTITSLVACGGSDSGGTENATTGPGTTPIDQNNDSTQHGTYAMTSFIFNYSTGETFTNNDTDRFEGWMTIDLANDLTASYLEFVIDGETFTDYDQSTLSQAEENVTYDGATMSQTGPYTITLYYGNVCADGYCANVLMRLRKTSNSIQNLLRRPAADKSLAQKSPVESMVDYFYQHQLQ